MSESKIELCPFSGVGKAQNVIFNRQREASQHEHDFEDKNFMLTDGEGRMFAYGVLGRWRGWWGMLWD